MSEGSGNPVVDRGNTLVIAAMSMLFLAPVIMFWGAVFGPLRPYRYAPVDPPSLLWFAAGLAVCALPCLLPDRYYARPASPRTMRLLESLGIRGFRRFASNGDLVNRWGRRSDPRYRTMRDHASVGRFLADNRSSECSHLVLLVAGLFTAVHAARLGWFGWAAWITFGNIVFNLYPVLLQHYNRSRMLRARRRLERILPASAEPAAAESRSALA